MHFNTSKSKFNSVRYDFEKSICVYNRSSTSSCVFEGVGHWAVNSRASPFCNDFQVYVNQDGTNETLAWQRRRNHGNRWMHGYVTVPSGGARSVTFEAVRGLSFQGDIAVDDITLRNGTCPQQGELCLQSKTKSSVCYFGSFVNPISS